MPDTKHITSLTIENKTSEPLTILFYHRSIKVIEPEQSYVYVLPVTTSAISIHSDIGSAIVCASSAANEVGGRGFGKLQLTFIPPAPSELADNITVVIEEGQTDEN